MTIQAGTYARLIRGAFRLGAMTPGLEAMIGTVMEAAVRGERKRVPPVRVYLRPVFAGGVYDAARETILGLLAAGPMYSRDIRPHLTLNRPQTMGLLGAMREDGLIVSHRPDGGTAALWGLA